MTAETLYWAISYLAGGAFASFIAMNFVAYVGNTSEDLEGADYVIMLFVTPLIWPISLPMFLIAFAGVWIRDRIDYRPKRDGKSVLDRLFDLATRVHSK